MFTVNTSSRWPWFLLFMRILVPQKIHERTLFVVDWKKKKIREMLIKLKLLSQQIPLRYVATRKSFLDPTLCAINLHTPWICCKIRNKSNKYINLGASHYSVHFLQLEVVVAYFYNERIITSNKSCSLVFVHILLGESIKSLVSQEFRNGLLLTSSSCAVYCINCLRKKINVINIE